MLENASLTKSEKLVSDLCKKSFLKLWVHPNPIGKKGKELCDLLVVCGDHVIIFSVKEVEYKDTGTESGIYRWIKAAIDKSVSQIYGAERWLKSSNVVLRHDERRVSLPPKNRRTYHRIAVALGSNEEVPMKWGDFDKGFVYVCDEKGLDALFESLDTITDFVEFLNCTEALMFNDQISFLFNGGGLQDLIGIYLMNGNSFEHMINHFQGPTSIIVEGDIWSSFVVSEEYQQRKKITENSYHWDRLINYYAEDLLTDGMFDMHSKEVTKNELALVEMALQPRRDRANLAECLLSFLIQETKVACRVVTGYNNTAFIFLSGSSDDRENRAAELMARCMIIRKKLVDFHTIIGIATDRPKSSKVGYSSDIAYLHIPEWNNDLEETTLKLEQDTGYFKDAIFKKISFD